MKLRERTLSALLLLAFLTIPSLLSALEPVTILHYKVFPTSGPDSFRRPQSVASFADGTLAILDDKTEELAFVKTNGERKSVSIEANAIESHDNILYVSTDQRILRFNSAGEELAPFADRTTLPFSRLMGLDVDARGNLYVADEGRDQVFVLSPDGLPLGGIGIGTPKEARLSGPTDVALDHRGHVYILDAGNDRIAVYTTGNHYVRELADMKEPIALASDTYGLLYASDANELRINRYEIGGAKLGAFGAKGRGRGQFRNPVDVSIGPDGLLRVLDNGNLSLHTLSWPVAGIEEVPEVPPLSVRYAAGSHDIGGSLIGMTRSGKFLVAEDRGDVTVYGAGMSPLATLATGEMKDPVAAAEGDDGRIYIADRSGGQIVVFGAEGNYLFSFGQGSRLYFFRGGDGKLVKPSGIAVSSSGVVAVADAEKVELFGPDGTYLFSAGAPGKEPGQIRRPVAVAFDGSGSLFVADASNQTISKFNDRGGYTSQSVGNIAPLAMASDKEGRIYVLDDNGPRIRIFNDDLEPLMAVGTEGWDIASLSKGRNMALSGDVLWVERKGGKLGRFHVDLPLRGPRDVKHEVGARNVLLAWHSPTQLPTMGFRLALTNKDDGSIITSDVNDTSVDLGRLKENTNYSLTMRTLNGLGNPGPSPTVLRFKTAPLLLEPPTAPTIAFGRDALSVRLKWDPSPSALVSKYAVEGRKTGDYQRLMVTPDNFASVSADGWLSYRVVPMTEDGKLGTPSEALFHVAAQAMNEAERGDMRLAAEYFWRAAEKEPDQLVVWRGLGLVSEELERFAEAEQSFHKALAIAPDDRTVLLGLARLALLRNEAGEAAGHFARVSAPEEADAEYLYVAGSVDLAEARYDTAVKTLTLAVSLDPSTRNRRALGRAKDDQTKFGQNRPRIELASVSFEPIFPALYKDYMSRAIGTAIVTNSGDAALERINFAVFIRSAMDFPTDKIIEKLEPGESIVVPIHVDLSNEILEATEDDTKQAEIRLTYFREGEPVVLKNTFPVRVYARNAVTWDDPTKIASFVTVRDPVVLDWARNIAAFPDNARFALLQPLRRAILLRAALKEFGLRYLEDPINPYSVVSERETVDHVQLPEETLRRKSGDCDDLVVLLASLLENLGVRTALVDLPGHILMMIDSEMPFEIMASGAADIPWTQHDGTAWLPVEATLIDGTLLDAARAGAIELEKAGARIIDVESAWRKYPPVSNLATDWRAGLPEKARVLSGVEADELEWRRANLRIFLSQLEKTAASADELAHQKAALHVRFGFFDEAEALLTGLPSSAAMKNNLGNIRLLRGDAEGARRFYEEAAQLDPLDPGIVSNLKRLEATAQ